jgi:hypothetical protein
VPRPPQGRARRAAGAGGLGAGGFLAAKQRACEDILRAQRDELDRTIFRGDFRRPAKKNEFSGSFRHSYVLTRFDLDDRLRLAMAARDRGDHREERKLLKAWAARGKRERLIYSWTRDARPRRGRVSICAETDRAIGRLYGIMEPAALDLSLYEKRGQR